MLGLSFEFLKQHMRRIAKIFMPSSADQPKFSRSIVA